MEQVFFNVPLYKLEPIFKRWIKEAQNEIQPKGVENTKQPEKFLNIQEAAKLLNLSVPTLYSKVSKRELPCMKQGKRLYFSQTDLINYIKKGKRKSSAEIEAEADAYLSNNKKGLNNGI